MVESPQTQQDVDVSPEKGDMKVGGRAIPERPLGLFVMEGSPSHASTDAALSGPNWQSTIPFLLGKRELSGAVPAEMPQVPSEANGSSPARGSATSLHEAGVAGGTSKHPMAMVSWVVDTGDFRDLVPAGKVFSQRLPRR